MPFICLHHRNKEFRDKTQWNNRNRHKSPIPVRTDKKNDDQNVTSDCMKDPVKCAVTN